VTTGRELVSAWLQDVMPGEPSDYLVAHVTERLRMAVNPGIRFEGDEPAEVEQWGEGFIAESQTLFDLLAVLDDDEINERARSLIEDAEKLLEADS
jgi:hypothetical protein